MEAIQAVASLDGAHDNTSSAAGAGTPLASAPASLRLDANSSPPSPLAPSLASSYAPSLAAASLTPSVALASARALELWGKARAAMKDGRLHKLVISEQYSVVSAVFSTLFPGDFDRCQGRAGDQRTHCHVCV